MSILLSRKENSIYELEMHKENACEQWVEILTFSYLLSVLYGKIHTFQAFIIFPNPQGAYNSKTINDNEMKLVGVVEDHQLINLVMTS